MGYFQKLFRPMGCNGIFQKIFVPWDGTDLKISVPSWDGILLKIFRPMRWDDFVKFSSHPVPWDVFQKNCVPWMGWDGMGLSHPTRSPDIYYYNDF
jgi:hypothetical protein